MMVASAPGSARPPPRSFRAAPRPFRPFGKTASVDPTPKHAISLAPARALSSSAAEAIGKRDPVESLCGRTDPGLLPENWSSRNGSLWVK